MMPPPERVTATRRTQAKAEIDRLYVQYRLRAGLVPLDAGDPVPPVRGLLNRALDAGLPDPAARDLWPDPIRQNWPAPDLLDLLGRATFHRACDGSRPREVRDAALAFLSGIVGLNHPKGQERVTNLQREETHHILGGDWGKPRAWLKRAAGSVGFSEAALRFAEGVRDGLLDAKRDLAEFTRALAEALGMAGTLRKSRGTLRTRRRTRG